VVVFTLVAGLSTCLFFGIVPALVSTRVKAACVLKDGGRSSSGASRQGLRKMLVTAQISLSLILLVGAGAGLLIQTLERLQHRDLGFRINHLMHGQLYLPPAQYATPESINEFSDRLTERLRAIPGVRAVSITEIYPPTDRWRMMFSIEGRGDSAARGNPEHCFWRSRCELSWRFRDRGGAGTGLFGIGWREDAARSDREPGFREEVFPGRGSDWAAHRGRRTEEFACGRRVDGFRARDGNIAGVMRDNRGQGLSLPVAPQLIALFRQMPRPVNSGFKDLLVRSDLAPEALEPSIERQLHAFDPRIPLSEAESMSEYLGHLTAVQRFTGVILSCFAGLGLMLAVMGIYGVIAYLVAQGTQEIGIRLALGAPRSAVLWLVASQGLLMALAGVAVGLLGTTLAVRSLTSLLYGISALDPLTLGLSSIVLIGVALAACVLPARRAARIDPMQVLRTE
jgi:putative ABC transport system permease protein